MSTVVMRAALFAAVMLGGLEATRSQAQDCFSIRNQCFAACTRGPTAERRSCMTRCSAERSQCAAAQRPATPPGGANRIPQGGMSAATQPSTPLPGAVGAPPREDALTAAVRAHSGGDPASVRALAAHTACLYDRPGNQGGNLTNCRDYVRCNKLDPKRRPVPACRPDGGWAP